MENTKNISKGTKAAMEVSEMLNSMSSQDIRDFISTMASDHRTLQEDFSQLCITWFETCAKEDYGYDGRNIYSHKFALALREKGLI